MTRRILITIEYDGARFVGWQRQIMVIGSSQIEAAAEAFIGNPTPVAGRRTDLVCMPPVKLRI